MLRSNAGCKIYLEIYFKHVSLSLSHWQLPLVWQAVNELMPSAIAERGLIPGQSKIHLWEKKEKLVKTSCRCTLFCSSQRFYVPHVFLVFTELFVRCCSAIYNIVLRTYLHLIPSSVSFDKVWRQYWSMFGLFFCIANVIITPGALPVLSCGTFTLFCRSRCLRSRSLLSFRKALVGMFWYLILLKLWNSISAL